MVDTSGSMRGVEAQRDIALANAILRQADVRFTDPAVVVLKDFVHDSVDSEADVHRLLSSIPGDFHGLNLFYVREVNLLNGEARGMAFRPLGYSANGQNAIFLARSRLAGLTLAHEFGHLMGLSHTPGKRDDQNLMSSTLRTGADRLTSEQAQHIRTQAASLYGPAAPDVDRTSDVRDLTSAAAFSKSWLNRPLTQAELKALVRPMTPLEGTGRMRSGYQSAPIVDFFATKATTDDAGVTDSYRPNSFNDINLPHFGVAIEKPFVISGNTDALLRFAYHRVNRDGLIEFLPRSREHISQYEASSALSNYVGPDRLNLSYIDINLGATNLQKPDREIISGTPTYQIFRPLSWTNANGATSYYFTAVRL